MRPSRSYIGTLPPRRVGYDQHILPVSGHGGGDGWRSHGQQHFDSLNPDSGGRISPLEALSRLERFGLRADDPRIAEALAGPAGADGSRRLSFAQFKALSQHNSSLIRRAVEGNLAVPDFATLTAFITRMYDELLPVRSGAVADYIPQLRRVDP